jgi:iron complex outermembrane recepter protein
MKRTLKPTFAFATLFVAFLLLGLASHAQDKKLVTGVVRDTSGLGVPGVSVKVKGTADSKGAITDDAGAFSLHAAAGEVLVFSSIGYLSKEATVGPNGAVSVLLLKNSSALGEVVVTGFGGRQSTRKLSYSVTEVKGSELVAANNSNIGDALQGKVAGVTISQGTGGPSSSSRIQIRGNARLQGNTEPLVVLDGILLQPATTGADSWGTGADFGNIVKDLNPDDYESLTILKGSAATAIYGEQGLNGVILITTKKGHARKGLGVTYNQTVSEDHAYKFVDVQNSYGGGLSPTFQTDANGNRLVDVTASVFGNPNGGYSYGPAFDGKPVKDLDGRIIPWKANNPLKDWFQNGQYINSNVAVEGGNENSTFRASWTNLWNTSVQPNNSLNKNAFTLRATQKLSSILSLDASVNYTSTKVINPIQQGGGGDVSGPGTNGNPVQDFVYLASRGADINYYRHNYIAPGGGLKQGLTEDPYWLATSIWPAFQNNNIRNENVLLGNLDLTAKILPWLTGLIRANVQNYNDETEMKYNGIGAGFSGGSYELIQSDYKNTRFQGVLTANKKFGEDFDLNFSAGGETNRQLGGNISDSKTSGGLQTPSLYFVSNSVDAPTITQTYNPTYRYDAIYAYGDLTWKDQLSLTYSLRNDWSSSLTYANGTGHYTYAYPAVGLAWVFTELPQFRNSNSVLSYGKLRASLGWTGYDAAAYTTNQYGNYGSVGTFYGVNGNQTQYSFSDGAGNYNTTLGNPHLKNELAREVEFGADVRFLNNRIGLDAAWYKKNSFNQIISLPADQESGVSSRYINAGNIQNEGIELLLTASPIKTKNFSWDMTVNFTRNVNKVISLYPGVQNYQLQLAFGADAAAYAVAGQQYGLVTTGYGYAHYQGKNASATGQKVIGSAPYGTTGSYYTFMRQSDYLPGTQDTLGNIMPRFLWGTFQTFTYKSFVLGIQVDSKVGGLMASATDQYGSETGSLKNTLRGRHAAQGGISFTPTGSTTSRDDGIIPDGVFADGTLINNTDVGGMSYAAAYKQGLVTPVPAYAYYENLYQWSSGIRAASIFDNSWVALRQVSLGYNLPQSVLKPLHLNALRFTLTGRNIIYIWKNAKDGINPEGLYNNQASAFAEGGGLPLIRSYGATLNASF